MPIEIFYQDSDILVLKKESGMHVHPPENKLLRVPREQILLYELKRQINAKLFPVHRLDVATSGLLIMALSSVAASKMCEQFANQTVKKKYKAVIRGYVQESGVIDLPLALDSTGEMVPACTHYQSLKQLQLDVQVTPKFPTSRYSLIQVEPQTGRYHQIRRHFNRISCPLIGDSTHGNSHHNRFFREQLKIEGLCLVADYLSFKHPLNNNILEFQLSMDTKWQNIYKLFDVPLN